MVHLRLSNFGWFSKAMAMASLCFIPIENWPFLLFLVLVMSTISSTSLIEDLNGLLDFLYLLNFHTKVGSQSWSQCFQNFFSATDAPQKMPEIGRSIPVTIFKNVDLPAPFGPSSPYIAFFCTVSNILLTAIWFLNALLESLVYKMVFLDSLHSFLVLKSIKNIPKDLKKSSCLKIKSIL